MYVLCPFNMSYICIYHNISYIFGLHTHIQTYISWESAFPAHFPGKSAFLMHSPSVRFPGLSGAMWPISGPLQWHVVKCSISSISLGHIWAGLDTLPPCTATCRHRHKHARHKQSAPSVFSSSIANCSTGLNPGSGFPLCRTAEAKSLKGRALMS